MPFLVVRHKVQDFGNWKKAFDAHGATRRAAGSKGGQVYRTRENPSEVVVVCEWDKLENARTFAKSEDLRKVMTQAGVIGTPDVLFLDDRDTFAT